MERKEFDHNLHHKCIYGATVGDIRKKNKKALVTDPFQKYRYLSNPNKDGSDDFIGFEYDRIYGLYHNYRYSYNDTLQISNNSVPDSIVELFAKTYPGVKANTYAFIEDKYKHSLTSADVIFGYWIFSDNGYSDDISGVNFETIDNDMQVYCPAHTMRNNPSDYFVGKSVGYLSYTFDPKSCHELEKKLHEEYKSVDIPSKRKILGLLREDDPDVTLSKLPMLVLLQGNCYCCT